MMNYLIINKDKDIILFLRRRILFFSIGCLLAFGAPNQLHAQNKEPHTTDSSITGKVLVKIFGSLTSDFSESVFLNGKLLTTGINSILSIPADSIRSIAVLRRPILDSPHDIRRYDKNNNYFLMISTYRDPVDSIKLPLKSNK